MATMEMDLAENFSDSGSMSYNRFHNTGRAAIKWLENKKLNYQLDKANAGVGLKKVIER